MDTIFWLLFGVTVAFIAWGFIGMLFDMVRGPRFQRREKRGGSSGTGGMSAGFVDANPGMTDVGDVGAGESNSSESSSQESGGSDSGTGETSGGGGEYGGGGASGGW